MLRIIDQVTTNISSQLGSSLHWKFESKLKHLVSRAFSLNTTMEPFKIRKKKKTQFNLLLYHFSTETKNRLLFKYLQVLIDLNWSFVKKRKILITIKFWRNWKEVHWSKLNIPSKFIAFLRQDTCDSSQPSIAFWKFQICSCRSGNSLSCLIE